MSLFLALETVFSREKHLTHIFWMNTWTWLRNCQKLPMGNSRCRFVIIPLCTYMYCAGSGMDFSGRRDFWTYFLPLAFSSLFPLLWILCKPVGVSLLSCFWPWFSMLFKYQIQGLQLWDPIYLLFCSHLFPVVPSHPCPRLFVEPCMGHAVSDPLNSVFSSVLV